MTGYHLAEINVARLLAPAGAPQVQGFFDALDAVNAAAEAATGFVWRLSGPDENAHADAVFDDPLLTINMSVWDSLEALMQFVYRDPVHLGAFRQKADWFEHMERSLALWWVPDGHIPSPEEGRARLEAIRREGPTPFAFDFRTRFDRSGAPI